MKIKKLICLIMVIIAVLGCSGCGCVNFKIPSFKEMCKTSADGFVYYVDRNIGLCIIELPKTEEVVIPEYIDGIKVAQLGYEEIGIMYSETHVVDGSHVKKLTIQHPMVYYITKFCALETLVYVDYLYCISNYENIKSAQVLSHFGSSFYYDLNTKVELIVSNRDYSVNCSQIEKIVLPKFVEVIEKGVFDKLTNVTFETSYSEKPSGWEEGWNGNNPVIWNSKVFGE